MLLPRTIWTGWFPNSPQAVSPAENRGLGRNQPLRDLIQACSSPDWASAPAALGRQHACSSRVLHSRGKCRARPRPLPGWSSHGPLPSRWEPCRRPQSPSETELVFAGFRATKLRPKWSWKTPVADSQAERLWRDALRCLNRVPHQQLCWLSSLKGILLESVSQILIHPSSSGPQEDVGLCWCFIFKSLHLELKRFKCVYITPGLVAHHQCQGASGTRCGKSGSPRGCDRHREGGRWP